MHGLTGPKPLEDAQVLIHGHHLLKGGLSPPRDLRGLAVFSQRDHVDGIVYTWALKGFAYISIHSYKYPLDDGVFVVFCCLKIQSSYLHCSLLAGSASRVEGARFRGLKVPSALSGLAFLNAM